MHVTTPPRAVIIHGYLSYPDEAWLPWLARELRVRGYAVELPAMPDPSHPVIETWIRFIAGVVGEPDQNTVMIGHSIGCQAVLRYLETVGAAGKAVRKTVLVAGTFPRALPRAAVDEIAAENEPLRPWFSTGCDPVRVRLAAGQCIAILSDNDPYIDVPHARSDFESLLGAQVIIDPGKGHFNEDDGLLELPSALEAVLG